MPGGPKEQECLRQVVCEAAELGLPAPGLMTVPGYLDGYRSAWLPANLIQAEAGQGLLAQQGHSWPLPMELVGRRTKKGERS